MLFNSLYPVHMGDLKSYPLRGFFIYTIYKSCTKYNKSGLTSIPEPRANIPGQTIVPKAISALKVKPTDIQNVYDLLYILCAHG